MSADSETRALQRLSRITWRDHGDGFIAMQGYFTPNGARELLQDLGEEAREALGLVFIANHCKAVMRKSLAEEIFRLEGLPLNIIHDKARAL